MGNLFQSEKQCTKCGSINPTSEHRRSRRSPDGLHGWCRACTNYAAAEYRRTRRGDFLAALRKWSKANQHKITAYNKANWRVKRHRERSQGLGLDEHFTQGELDRLIMLSNGVCFYCGSGAKLEVDHLVPLSRGGSNRISNICMACEPCNCKKHRQTAFEFINREVLSRAS